MSTYWAPNIQDIPENVDIDAKFLFWTDRAVNAKLRSGQGIIAKQLQARCSEKPSGWAGLLAVQNFWCPLPNMFRAISRDLGIQGRLVLKCKILLKFLEYFGRSGGQIAHVTHKNVDSFGAKRFQF